MLWKPETCVAWTQKVCVTFIRSGSCDLMPIVKRHFVPYSAHLRISFHAALNKTYCINLKLNLFCSLCFFRHRSADHHQRHGDPHFTAHPRDAGGFLPMPGVRLQHPCGGGSWTHRRAGCVSQLQHHPQSGTHSQSLGLFRQTDGESLIGLVMGHMSQSKSHLISEYVKW